MNIQNDLKPDGRLTPIAQKLWVLKVQEAPGLFDKGDRKFLRRYAKIYGRLARKIQAFHVKLNRLN